MRGHRQEIGFAAIFPTQLRDLDTDEKQWKEILRHIVSTVKECDRLAPDTLKREFVARLLKENRAFGVAQYPVKVTGTRTQNAILYVVPSVHISIGTAQNPKALSLLGVFNELMTIGHTPGTPLVILHFTSPGRTFTIELSSPLAARQFATLADGYHGLVVPNSWSIIQPLPQPSGGAATASSAAGPAMAANATGSSAVAGAADTAGAAPATKHAIHRSATSVSKYVCRFDVWRVTARLRSL